jgi:hypothetical protein
MAVESLSPDAQAVIRRALAFISTTRQLDREFESRLGLDRGELAEVLCGGGRWTIAPMTLRPPWRSTMP